MFDMSNVRIKKMKKAYIWSYFVYICEFNVLQFSRLVKLILFKLTLMHRKVVCQSSGGIYIQKEKKNISLLPFKGC